DQCLSLERQLQSRMIDLGFPLDVSLLLGTHARHGCGMYRGVQCCLPTLRERRTMRPAASSPPARRLRAADGDAESFRGVRQCPRDEITGRPLAVTDRERLIARVVDGVDQLAYARCGRERHFDL